MTLKITNIGKIVTSDPEGKEVLTLTNQEILISDGKIRMIASTVGEGDEILNAEGGVITPGLVDAHTHPVFTSLRIEEFALRAVGMSYQEIAAAGGGILASVRAVREASQEELEEAILQRLEKFLALGTTTLEAKSGYGLSLEAELKSLRALKHAADRSMIDVVVTFLGAHDFPQEYRRRKDDYVALICEEMIPAVAEENLAEYCDVFCEKGWYTVEQSRQILETAINYGLKPRLHADEFTDSGAASLAAEIGATSADHLMYVSEVGLRKMGVAGVVATLLPGTTFFLGQQMFAPARKIIDAGLTVALATDYNPGSSFIQSLPFIMSLASLYLQMTVEEAFRAVTFGGAAALQKQEQMGTITVGRQADIVLWAIDDLAELACRIGENRVQAIVKRGEIMKLS